MGEPCVGEGDDDPTGMCVNASLANDPCAGVTGACVKREVIETYNPWCAPGLQDQDCRGQCFIVVLKGTRARDMPVQVLTYDNKGGLGKAVQVETHQVDPGVESTWLSTS